MSTPSLPTSTPQWILTNKPTGLANLDTSSKDATFTLKTADLPQLQPSQILLRTLYLSNDPAQRGWIDPTLTAERSYVPPVEVGDVMRAGSICEVISAGASASLSAGALVFTRSPPGWSKYAVVDSKAVQPLPVDSLPRGVSVTHFLGALGLTGLTAWAGLVEVAQAQASDVVVVSGAAGATGSMAVQIAKGMIGCKRVIGIAGGPEKCRWVESLGADVCVDYKASGWREALLQATEGRVDVFFDNVGGEQLDFMLGRLKMHGRVAVCGAISQYNSSGKAVAFENFTLVNKQRLQIRGFIVFDHMDKQAEVTQAFLEAVKEGKLKIGDEMETVVESDFEHIPHTWMRLFEGKNQGKLVTKLVG